MTAIDTSEGRVVDLGGVVKVYLLLDLRLLLSAMLPWLILFALIEVSGLG